MADSYDAIFEARLADCASMREQCLATLRGSEETTKRCLASLRDLDEFAEKLKNRRCDKLEQTAEKPKDDRVDDGDDREDVNQPHTSFKRDRAVQQSRLLSLPPEIRNMIWKLCVFHPDDLARELSKKRRRDWPTKSDTLTMAIDPESVEARPKLLEGCGTSVARRTRRSMREHSLRNLALMQTCQDVYNETAPMMWSQRFHFSSIKHLQAFLFSNARMDLVRDIFVWDLDRQVGVNYMPAVCALLADKVKGLERFEVDMSHMDKGRQTAAYNPHRCFRNKRELQEAGVKLGFDIYSCMYPWVTKVVRDQGIEKLMDILQIPRQTMTDSKGNFVALNLRTHSAFQRGLQLNGKKLKIAHTAAAGEILRLVNLYDK